MFIDAEVTHKKYGKGTIIGFELNPEQELASRIEVQFDSGEYKKFPLSTVEKFITGLPEDCVEYLTILNKPKTGEVREIEDREGLKELLSYHPLSVTGNTATREQWEEMLQVAGTNRYTYEARSVIRNGNLIFLDAQAACSYCNLSPALAPALYRACDIGRRWQNMKWTYATVEDIQSVIDRLEE